jgi:hypothetical protein
MLVVEILLVLEYLVRLVFEFEIHNQKTVLIEAVCCVRVFESKYEALPWIDCAAFLRLGGQ